MKKLAAIFLALAMITGCEQGVSVKESVSEPLPKRKVSNLQKDEHRVSWTYPDDQMKIAIEQKGDYLQVQLESTGAESFTWPTVSGTSYMLPLGEGKWIPPSPCPLRTSFLLSIQRRATAFVCT
ncbi:hypothetical protein [Brevibacillus centrosporus]|uniref:hypothetical protein n=1 Tax=Brevibacillus centrosporus TaxID=54910 RepID=UPI003987BA1A